MKTWYKHYLSIVAMLLSFAAFSQDFSSFSGSAKGGNSNFNFYNPILFRSKTFSDKYFSSGHIQMLTDTTAVFDTTIAVYDLDSIPEQVVFYNNPCRFFLKSDSLVRAGIQVTGRNYYVVEGQPKGTIQLNRLNLFEYTTNVDTFDFALKFALVTSTGDTVKGKNSVKFKIIPTLPFESATFGIGGQRTMPDPEAFEFQVQSADSSQKVFNYVNQFAKTLNFSGVQVVLKNNNIANSLHLLNNTLNLDTLNIYAETVIIGGGFNFPSTTINIYAKELTFIDGENTPSFLNTTPVDKTTSVDTANGAKAGDIHLYISKFTSNPGIRFIMNGGNGQKAASGNAEGSGGNGGNLYSTVDVRNYMVSVGGHSPSRQADGQSGAFIFNSNRASWLHPNYLHLVIAYNKEGYYAGLTEPVVKNLKVYSDSISAYAADSSIYKLEEDNVFQIAAISDEINQVFYNIANNLDYYGNPPGWVPMLSFEVAEQAYTYEVDHALNVLFLDKLVQSATNTLQTRQNTFIQLRDETETLVSGNKEKFYYLCYEEIPRIKGDIDTNVAKMNSLKDELTSLNEELDKRSQELYDERQTWKWVGVAGDILSVIPSPYTQAASTALSFGVKALASDNQKKGFQEGSDLGEIISQTIKPFTSGQVLAQGEQLGTNVSAGVGDIFEKIGNIGSLNDVIEIAKQSKQLYDDNKKLYDSMSQSVGGVVNLYNNIIRVDNSEYGSIRGELVANEPRLREINEKMQFLVEEQQRLGHLLETATQEMITSKNNVYIGLAAIGNFNFQAYNTSAAYDHKLSVLSFDMRRKAFERLRKYYYYMLKAYEYRTIDTSLGDLWSLNLNNVLMKIDSLVTIAGKTSLTQADIDVLKSIYEDPIHQIAEKIITYYQSNQAGKSATVRFRLTKDEINDLNLGKTITINMVDKGLFPTKDNNYREDIRIGNLQVSTATVETVVADPNTISDYLDFTFDYPNYSRIQKNGMLYSFNNYNRNTEHPIRWGTDYDIESKILSPVTLSDASKSLLYVLFEGTSVNPANVELYARPAAWADIKLSITHITNAKSIVKLDSLTIDCNYDFQYKPTNIAEVELNTNYKWFAPTFDVSKIDKYSRQDGIGNIYRAYTKSSNSITATTPKEYGRYIFTNWADRSGNPLTSGNGIDLSGGNTIKFSLSTDQSFKAMYKFDGPVLQVPDTVYLGQAVTYNLQIKNIGSGYLFWRLDSSSTFVHYPDSLSGINDSTVTLAFDPNSDTLNKRIGFLDITSAETESLHNNVYFVQDKRVCNLAKPSITANNLTTNVCPSKCIKLTSSPANKYLWSTGDTTQSISVCTAGSYTVTVTDISGCKNTSGPTVVTYQGCSVPSGLLANNITATSAMIQWNISTCAVGYQYQYRKKGTTAWTTVYLSGKGNSSTTLTGLTPGTRYQWQVRTRCKTTPDVSNSKYEIGPEFTTATNITALESFDTNVKSPVNSGAKLYPNPSTGNITVTYNSTNTGNVQLKITDVAGRQVFTKEDAAIKGINTYHLDLSNLAAGVYFLELNRSNERSTIKFVIQK